MRRLRDPAPEEQPQRRPGEAPPRGPGDSALEAALRRCEERDPSGVSQLWAWQNGRLGRALERMLGDPQLARQALENMLADLWQNAGGYRTAGVSAEDWVFAHLRLHARDAQRQGLARPADAPAGVGPVPARAPATDRPLPRPGAPPERAPEADEIPHPPMPAPPEAALADSLDATRRVRRSAGAAPAAPGEIDDEPYQAGGRWRRRLLFLLLWALAGGAGFGLALYTLGGPPVDEGVPRPVPAAPPPASAEAPGAAAPPPQPAPGPPAPTTAAPPPPPLPVEVPPPIRDLIGDPLVAPEPPATVRPRGGPDLGLSPAELAPETEAEVPATAPAPARSPPPQAAVPGQDRIFIHHRAGDAASAGLADRLAEALQRGGSGIVVIRSVPFGIGRPGVRYFHAGDRAAAEALVRAAGAALGADGYAAPRAASDFTDYRPAPRPGTLEIWLPGA
jgi:DNA-directed RNA polymerase specialized sigma24 family protein